MTAVESMQSLTALGLLAGEGETIPQVLAGPPPPNGVVGNFGDLDRLPEAARLAASREINATAAGLLDVSLIGMLIAGWRAHHDLTLGARRTLAVPGSTELVNLATHQITVEKHPSVTILVDGRRVAILQLDLSVVFDITAMLAGIRAGRLVALHSGRCDITATLAIDGTDIVTRQTRLELSGAVPLGSGIPLLAAAEYPAGSDPDNDVVNGAQVPH